MKKIKTQVWRPTLTVIFLLLISTSANATAIFVANIVTPTLKWPDDWKYHISSGDPVNGNTCLSSGSAIPHTTNSIGVQSSDLIKVTSLEPPFSGTKSGSRYLTACRPSDGTYITVHMTITLGGCAAWICQGNWSYGVVRTVGSPYSTYFGSIWPDSIDIQVPF